MEVHQHTHTARKKWTHFLWKFMMLFLIVFCGFLAEYKLEHVMLTKDPQVLRPYANHVFIDQALNRIYYDNLIEHKKLGIYLLNLIQKKYHFK
jgi:hypothetical protein